MQRPWGRRGLGVIEGPHRGHLLRGASPMTLSKGIVSFSFLNCHTFFILQNIFPNHKWCWHSSLICSPVQYWSPAPEYRLLFPTGIWTQIFPVQSCSILNEEEKHMPKNSYVWKNICHLNCPPVFPSSKHVWHHIGISFRAMVCKTLDHDVVLNGLWYRKCRTAHFRIVLWYNLMSLDWRHLGKYLTLSVTLLARKHPFHEYV